jgi:hypothetical protein
MQPDDAAAIESQLRQLETGLSQPAVRTSRETLSSLLAEEFCEFGSSGRIYTRQQAINALSIESPVRYTISDFSVAILTPVVALARYQAIRHTESGQMDSKSSRSSLWVLRDHRWQMLFHQGTETTDGDPPTPASGPAP